MLLWVLLMMAVMNDDEIAIPGHFSACSSASTDAATPPACARTSFSSFGLNCFADVDGDMSFSPFLLLWLLLSLFILIISTSYSTTGSEEKERAGHSRTAQGNGVR